MTEMERSSYKNESFDDVRTKSNALRQKTYRELPNYKYNNTSDQPCKKHTRNDFTGAKQNNDRDFRGKHINRQKPYKEGRNDIRNNSKMGKTILRPFGVLKCMTNGFSTFQYYKPKPPYEKLPLTEDKPKLQELNMGKIGHRNEVLQELKNKGVNSGNIPKNGSFYETVHPNNPENNQQQILRKEKEIPTSSIVRGINSPTSQLQSHNQNSDESWNYKKRRLENNKTFKKPRKFLRYLRINTNGNNKDFRKNKVDWQKNHNENRNVFNNKKTYC